MKSINLLVRIILVLPLLILPAGCGGGGGSPAPSGPSLSRITVTPATATIAAGSSQQFTATGTFSDGSTQDLTTRVTWSTNGVVQIGSSTGLATSSTSGGTATITASLGTITGSATLIVTGGNNAGANVMAISVNGSLCSSSTSAGYFNKPCVSVTVCNPDGSLCHVVNDILLDTGSYGLRIFGSALTGLTLPQTSSGSGSLAECIQFADGSSVWGPVKTASVRMGNEPAVQVPIQVIDASFGTPTSCGTPDATPVAAGFTGVLGIGPLPQDCGSSCINQGQGIYFSCSGASCTSAGVSLANQVQNPVAILPVDNNGVLVQLPAVTGNGLPSLSGSLILGIGTQANNIPASPTVLPTNQRGDFSVTFNGVTSTSFVDTGSNALFFASSLPTCASPNNVWYCPPSTQTFSATMIGSGGSPSKAVSFDIGNADTLFATSNQVYYDIGGTSTFGFDWGLPFFMGKNVFVGISGTTTPGLGAGPFIAFQ